MAFVFVSVWLGMGLPHLRLGALRLQIGVVIVSQTKVDFGQIVSVNAPGTRLGFADEQLVQNLAPSLSLLHSSSVFKLTESCLSLVGYSWLVWLFAVSTLDDSDGQRRCCSRSQARLLPAGRSAPCFLNAWANTTWYAFRLAGR